MSSTIRGINIKIGADTTALSSALKDVNKQSRKIGRELGKVNRSLKFNPGNTELLAQKQDLLADRVEATKQKLDTLRKSQEDVNKQFREGELPDEKYRAFRREVIETENKLEYFTDQLKETKREASEFSRKMKIAAANMEKYGNKMKGVGETLNTKVTLPLTAAFFALTEGTRDFRKELSVLENNAKSAGAGMDLMNKSMGQMNAVTGELDSNVEGLSNLLAAGFKGDQFQQVLDDLSGAAIKFKDTLKFEGIADGLQETLATGNAIGPFAELLERSGIQLDNFNAGLQEAIKNGEEKNYILQTLASTGLSQVYEQYRKNNKALVESAEAHYDLQSSLAELGKELEPILTDIIEGVTDVVDAFNSLSDEQKEMVLFGAAVAAALGPVLTITGNLSLTISSLTTAITSAGGLTAAVGSLASAFGPFLVGGIIISGIIALANHLRNVKEEAELAAQSVSEAITVQEASEQLDAVEKTLEKIRKEREDLVSGRNSIIGGVMTPHKEGVLDDYDEQIKDLEEKEKELTKTIEDFKRKEAKKTADQVIQEKQREYRAKVSLGMMEQEKYEEFLQEQIDNEKLSLEMRARLLEELARLDEESVNNEDSGEGPTKLETFLSDLDKEIDNYNFEQRLKDIGTTWQKEIEKLKKERKNKLITAESLGADEDTLDGIESFYDKQIADVIKEAKNKALDAEKEYQNELILMRKEGEEKELEQLDQRMQKELELNKDYPEAENEIREKYRILREKVRDKYDQQEKEAAEKLQNDLALLQKEGEEKELEQLEQWYEDEKETHKNQQEALIVLDKLYLEKKKDLDDKYAEQDLNIQDEIMQNKFALNQISLDNYKAYLQERLKNYEEFTDEWLKLKEKIDNLEVTPGEIKSEYDEQLVLLEQRNKTFGESFDFVAEKTNLVKNTIERLIETGNIDSKIFKELSNLYSEMTKGDGEDKQSLNWMTDSFVDMGLSIEQANSAFKNWQDDLVYGLTEAITQGESLSDVFSNIADQIAAMTIQRGIVEPFVDFVLGGVGLDTAHTGAYVSPAGLIRDMPRYHTGISSVPGLKNDEVPAILQTKERVLSREQNKAFEAGEFGKTEVHHHYNINAVDAASFAQLVQRNPDAITGVVAEDYSKNGLTRKIIKGDQ